MSSHTSPLPFYPPMGFSFWYSSECLLIPIWESRSKLERTRFRLNPHIGWLQAVLRD